MVGGREEANRKGALAIRSSLSHVSATVGESFECAPVGALRSGHEELRPDGLYTDWEDEALQGNAPKPIVGLICAYRRHSRPQAYDPHVCRALDVVYSLAEKICGSLSFRGVGLDAVTRGPVRAQRARIAQLGAF